MNSTTIVVASIAASTPTTLWTFDWTNNTFGNIIVSSASSTVVLPTGFALYVTVSVTDSKSVLDVSSVVDALTVQNAASPAGTLTTLTLRSGSSGDRTPTPVPVVPGAVTLSASGEYYVQVPYALPPTAGITNLAQRLQAALITAASSPPLQSSSPASGSSVGSSLYPSVSTSSSSISTNGTSSSDGAAASATDITPATSSASSSISPREGGLIGGIAGALVVGLLVGALISFLFARRRRGDRKQSAASPTVQESKSNGAAKEMPLQDLSVAGGLIGWRKHLPQAQSEHAFGGQFRDVFGLIDLHVSSYYGSSHTQATSEHISKLGNIADQETIDYLRRTSDSASVLKRTIAAFVIAKISLRADPADSFLPMDLSSTPRKLQISLEDVNVGTKPPSNRRGFMPAFADWRVLTSFLTTGVNDSAQADLDAKIHQASRSLTSSLSGFEQGRQDRVNQDRALRKILERTAEAGQALFMQPATFVFDWEHGRSGENNIVVFPALIKIIDESGQRLDKASVLISAKISKA